MEHEPKIQQELEPKDISQEFATLSTHDFNDYLRTLKEEPVLFIRAIWEGDDFIWKARRLKAFLEDSSVIGKQKRFATIVATKEQHDLEMNVFGSGVEWEKVE